MCILMCLTTRSSGWKKKKKRNLICSIMMSLKVELRGFMSSLLLCVDKSLHQHITEFVMVICLYYVLISISYQCYYLYIHNTQDLVLYCMFMCQSFFLYHILLEGKDHDYVAWKTYRDTLKSSFWSYSPYFRNKDPCLYCYVWIRPSSLLPSLPK